MFQLDDKFLEDVGLNELPEEQKKPFLQYVYDKLELEVGTKLSEGMSDEQLEEFESIIDHKDNIVKEWLENNAPDYHNDEAFGRIQQATGLDANDPGLRAEYAATKWLEVNRPDYRQVVAQVLAEIKGQILENRNGFLGIESADQPAA
jgi:hypothetical protein